MTLIMIDEYAWYPPGVEEAIKSIQTERYEMKTANRKPKLNKKPSKGMKNFFKQGIKSLKNIMARASDGTQRPEQWWHTPETLRDMWLYSFSGNHTPHQGNQEKARRVRQMTEHKCINPECWTTDYSALNTMEIVQESS